jgi:hypothetical protein
MFLRRKPARGSLLDLMGPLARLHRAGGRARTDHIPGARDVGPPDLALDIEHDPTTRRRRTAQTRYSATARPRGLTRR